MRGFGLVLGGAYHIRDNINNPDKFKKVHFVISNESIYELLNEATKLNSNYFELELLTRN